jgi:flagellar assembly factor FliW
MKISSRLGPIEIDGEHLLHFPSGLVGWEDCTKWVLLSDQQNDALAWLQSVDRPDVAVPVTSPRRFVPGYQIRVARRELVQLGLDDAGATKVLVTIGRTAGGLTLDLKAPLLLNLQRRLGRQVTANGDLPLRYELGSSAITTKRIA